MDECEVVMVVVSVAVTEVDSVDVGVETAVLVGLVVSVVAAVVVGSVPGVELAEVVAEVVDAAGENCGSPITSQLHCPVFRSHPAVQHCELAEQRWPSS